MFIDTHAHLYLQQFADDIDSVMQRAKDNKVEKIFLPNIDTGTVEAMNKLAERFPMNCYPMLGLHPCSVDATFKEALATLKSCLDSGNYWGIGETGIDLYWDRTFENEQEEAFETQIEWSIEKNLPVIIHSRDSLDRTIGVIERYKGRDVRPVFHCFNGSVEEARRIMDLGGMMGLGGVITFKNAGLDAMLDYVNLNHVILETDAPYLSPVPYRGKRNESSYIPYIAAALAKKRGMDVEEIEEITTANAKDLFGLQ